MKRFASILFAIAILLTSGLVQFVVHICPEKGASISTEACTLHETPAKPDCCKDIHLAEEDLDHCCTDSYFFAVTPKFGSIAHEKLSAPCVSECLFDENFQFLQGQVSAAIYSAENLFGKPPLYNRSVQQFHCSYQI